MKYLVVLSDGMADEPLEELGCKTPVEYANTPNMDKIAREGACGMLKTVPDGYTPGSDVANLSVLGYNPAECYTGRGPLEAVSMGIDVADDDVCYRCNLVTIEDGIMKDFSAGHISGAEGAELLRDLDREIKGAAFYPGVSYRNLMVVPSGQGAETTPPHDIIDADILEYMPKGDDADLLCSCMDISKEIFSEHPVNKARKKKGKAVATQVWPWSGGKKPLLEDFKKLRGVSGAMISAVDLLNGIARCAGMKVISVPGATGYLDTDYDAKAEYAIEALKEYDYLYLHVEAPDEAGHLGSVEEKIKAIERVDAMIGRILQEFEGRVAVLPDHPTPVRLKTHTSNPVPFAILGKDRDECRFFSEDEAIKGMYGLIYGSEFIELLLS